MCERVCERVCECVCERVCVSMCVLCVIYGYVMRQKAELIDEENHTGK